MTKTNFQKYAGIALASTVVIGGIASAAITPIPVISNTFAVAGQVIKSADINKLAEALNILDARTKWVDVPLTDTNPFDVHCEYIAIYNDTGEERAAQLAWVTPTFASVAMGTDIGHYSITIGMSSSSKSTTTDTRFNDSGIQRAYNLTTIQLKKRCE